MEIRAELTATVWKVVVEQGATVAEGDELVILESMKMEIPVVATVAGTVTEMRVGEEDRINEGDVVAVIDPAENRARVRCYPISGWSKSSSIVKS